MESVPPSSIGSCCMAMDLLIYVWYAHGSRWFPYSMWWFWKVLLVNLEGCNWWSEVETSGCIHQIPRPWGTLALACRPLLQVVSPAMRSPEIFSSPGRWATQRSLKPRFFFKGLIGHLLLENWLVVWSMNFIFPYIGNNNPIWLIFFRGVETTNQVGKSLLGSCWIAVHAVVPWVGILGCRLFV